MIAVEGSGIIFFQDRTLEGIERQSKVWQACLILYILMCSIVIRRISGGKQQGKSAWDIIIVRLY